MKILLTFTMALFLFGCGKFQPMNEFESQAWQKCLDKGFQPEFYAISSRRELTCNPDKLMLKKAEPGKRW